MVNAIQDLGLKFPKVSADKMVMLEAARARLEKTPNGDQPEA